MLRKTEQKRGERRTGWTRADSKQRLAVLTHVATPFPPCCSGAACSPNLPLHSSTGFSSSPQVPLLQGLGTSPSLVSVYTLPLVPSPRPGFKSHWNVDDSRLQPSLELQTHASPIPQHLHWKSDRYLPLDTFTTGLLSSD